MKTEWKEYKVEEFAEVIGGGTPNTTIDEFWNGDIPWLTPKDLSSNTDIYVEKGERFITPDGLSNSSAKLLPPDSILLSTRAPVGYLAISKVPLTTNQGFRNLILKEGFSSKFIYYLLKNNISYLQSNASGTTFGELSGSVLKSLKFKIPPLTIQERIADILGSLDDKIELNQHMNQTLESMARALFKSWFVDFEPVYAKMEGRDYPLPAEIMDLFPDELVDSELGLIPKGWRIKPLDKVADFLNGLAMQKYPTGENQDYIPVIKIRELRDGFTSQNSDRANINFPYDYIINNGDILFSWSGSLLVKIWCGGIGGLNQHLFKVTSTEFPKWFYYLWTSYYLNEFIKIAADKATTMGHIKKSDLHKSLVCIPDASILDVGNSFIGSFFERTINNSLQISTLMKARDSLLPYLVSGKIKI
jgi:type I restriction enzyme S subunit